MTFDRPNGQEQLGGDLPVGPAPPDQSENVDLAGREAEIRSRGGVRPDLQQEPRGSFGVGMGIQGVERELRHSCLGGRKIGSTETDQGLSQPESGSGRVERRAGQVEQIPRSVERVPGCGGISAGGGDLPRCEPSSSP